MMSENGSGVTGTGQVIKGTGSFTVTIKLTGLAASSSHISHVHTGACATPGGIAYALSQVVADASGNATVTSTGPADYAVSGGWLVCERPPRPRFQRSSQRAEHYVWRSADSLS